MHCETGPRGVDSRAPANITNMKLQQRFSRRLKTSRKYVFENIMDLDHVCALHRRWFENLRIRTWRADYVDYRLTSKFYGLKQEIDVSGAPLDEDRYWYEFNGSMARIRVEGEMRGPDGNLTLTETITFECPWFLAPFIRLLAPLFKRQKLDILRDDSALLERVQRLEQEGFRRSDGAAQPKVVVYGGAGYFGGEVVQDLLEHTNAQITVASRNPRSMPPERAAGRVRFYISDCRDRDSVSQVIHDATVVINCIGPFQGQGLDLLRACIEKRVHYIDVADDRDFVERVHRLRPEIERAGIMAFIGCSVVPGISGLLTERCAQELGQVDAVRVCITPGTRHTRGPGSFECLLSTVGKLFSIPHDGTKRTVIGWSEPERVKFPLPLGTRTVYSVVDIADYFTLVEYFGARTVDFKIGSEFGWLNKALVGVREVRRHLGLPRLGPLVPTFRAVLAVAGFFGTSQGAVMVTVTGGRDIPMRQLSLAAYAEKDGQIIPALLPSIAAGLVLEKRIAFEGIADLRRWISFDRLLAELRARGVHIAEHQGAWQRLSESGRSGESSTGCSA